MDQVYHTELDATEEIYQEGVTTFQELIGSLWECGCTSSKSCMDQQEL